MPEPLQPGRRDGPPPRAAAIVPARLGSRRMPRKMLRRDTGRYLFEHTVRNAERSPLLRAVWLATDSEEILAAAREVGIEAVMTSRDHASGTDRIFEALELLRARGEAADIDVVINVQGDEPELAPEDLTVLVEAFADPEVEIATLWTPLESPEELRDESVVKVVCDAQSRALYFSRAPVPDASHARSAQTAAARRHVGVYAYRPAALARFCALEPTPLEVTESLEQLRWLENGGRMDTRLATRSTRGIDTEADYQAFALRCEAAGRITSSKETAEETTTP